MSVKANNFKLGVFVIVSTLLLLVGLSLLGAGALFKKTIRLETVFTESVIGLSVGAPVKSRGVQLGTVSKINFVRFTYPPKSVEERLEFGGYVLVEIEFEPKVFEGIALERWEQVMAEATGEGMRIRMASSGLTGPPYLSISRMDPEKNPAPELYFTPRGFYIPSAPSTISRFVSSIERILDQLDQVEFKEIAAQTKTLLANADSAVQETRPGIAEIKRFVRRLDNMAAEQEADLEAIVVELRSVLDNLDEITGNAKSNPSQMIFGDPPPRIDPANPNAKPKR
jgi:phospholipid/cholesterol/gamma-HCH transport system substrate-binding protein